MEANICCGSFNLCPAIAVAVPEKSRIFTSIFAPFAWATGYWNSLSVEISIPRAHSPFVARQLPAVSSEDVRYIELGVALKHSPSLIARPAEPCKRYLILIGVIPADLCPAASLYRSRPHSPCYPRYPSSLKSYFPRSIRFFFPLLSP